MDILGILSASDLVSPSKVNRTRTVREYEQVFIWNYILLEFYLFLLHINLYIYSPDNKWTEKRKFWFKIKSIYARGRKEEKFSQR